MKLITALVISNQNEIRTALVSQRVFTKITDRADRTGRKTQILILT